MKKHIGSALMYMGSDDECRRIKNSSTCEWSAGAVSCLLDSYAEKFSVGRGYLKTKDWEEVVSKVNNRCEGDKSVKTMRQCRDKVDSLKRRYKTEKQKAEGGASGQVAWPLYNKLDEMMGSVVRKRRRRAPEVVNIGQKTSFSDRVPSREEIIKNEFSDSPEEDCAVESIHFNAPGQNLLRQTKAEPQEMNGLSEDDDENTPSDSLRKLSYRLTTQESADCSSDYHMVAQMPAVPDNVATKKRKAKPIHPMQALADAVLGFSEVYARIELAKMEIFTKMKLEMAKLGKRSSKRQASSASSFGSG